MSLTNIFGTTRSSATVSAQSDQIRSERLKVTASRVESVMRMLGLVDTVCKRASGVLTRAERHAGSRSATDHVARSQVTQQQQRTSAATTAHKQKSAKHEHCTTQARSQPSTPATQSIASSKHTFATGSAAQCPSSSTTSQKTPRHTVGMLLKALNEMGLVACTGLVRSDSLDDIRKLQAEVLLPYSM